MKFMNNKLKDKTEINNCNTSYLSRAEEIKLEMDA